MGVPFTRMDQSTAADWHGAVAGQASHSRRVADQVLGLLGSLAERADEGGAIDQLTHSLQTATRAERDGAGEELVLAALCHDVGRAISDANHAAISAAILAPYVRPQVAWVVRVHHDFTSRYFAVHFGGSRHRRLRHLPHPGYGLAARFADEWDQISFDPGYDVRPLEHFEPLVRRCLEVVRYPVRPRRPATRPASQA